MKLRMKVTGPRVHDVFYESFLMSLAFERGIMKFGVDAEVEDGRQVITVRIEAEEEFIDNFKMGLESKKPPEGVEISSIQFEPFDGHVPDLLLSMMMNFCATCDRLFRERARDERDK